VAGNRKKKFKGKGIIPSIKPLSKTIGDRKLENFVAIGKKHLTKFDLLVPNTIYSG